MLRLRAALIDSALVPIVALGFLIRGHAAGVIDPSANFMLLALPVIVLEPGMVAFDRGDQPETGGCSRSLSGRADSKPRGCGRGT